MNLGKVGRGRQSSGEEGRLSGLSVGAKRLSVLYEACPLLLSPNSMPSSALTPKHSTMVVFKGCLTLPKIFIGGAIAFIQGVEYFTS